ncbi:MAG: right-handed parallel beta-helix repeat-containing protein [Planctomycetota bacterium]|jgi:parallel beta-helix repeat protein
MKAAVILVAVLSIPTLAFSATIHVPDDYLTIQEAIDAAVKGDTVIVKPGTYVENIDFLGKAVTVKSELGPEITIIDGNRAGSVVVFENGEKLDSVLDGFTITNGYAYKGAGILCESSEPTLSNNIIKLNEANNNGGGLYNRDHSRPTVKNCTFEENSASKGGGMSNRKNSSVKVADCTFTGNRAGFGGGIFNEESSATIADCIFIGNTEGFGGGIFNSSHGRAWLTGCIFTGNGAAFGGGIFNSGYCSLSVTDCTFDGNTASHGGGVFTDGSEATLARCTFIENSSSHGGGINSSYGSATVTDCIFTGNRAGSGGGILNSGYCSLSVTDCIFTGNRASNGGGIESHGTGIERLIDCTFFENQADKYGGGMHNFGSDPSVSNCRFEANSASYGGGMRNFYSRPTLTNCIFYGNSAVFNGGGMSNNESNPTLTNCTFYGNTGYPYGGGLCNKSYSKSTLTNCILWNDSPDEFAYDSSSSFTVSYSCVQGGWYGAGNIESNPLFVDGANGDLHLTFPSPCRDAGDSSAVTESCDCEGDPRIAWSVKVDMGADEFYRHLYLTGDFAPGGSVECKLVGLPGTSPNALFFSSCVHNPPMPTAWGNFHLKAPWRMLPLMPIPGDGVLVLPSTIPATPPAPYDLPMQALIGLDPDSLSNLFLMEVQ